LRPTTKTRRLTLAVLCVLSCVLAAAAVPAIGPPGQAPAGGSPRCFGAAARDPARPCHNPALRLSVTPAPSVAARSPNAACRTVAQEGPLRLCTFGVATEQAEQTVVLVGDSHASHWRAAVEHLALARRWTGISLARTSCPLARAVRDIPEPQRSRCVRWNRAVLRWFTQHPDIAIVFTGELSGGRGVIARPGADKFQARVSGFLRAWRALAPTVRHIVVIRDTPKSRPPGGVAACVAGAVARRRDAGEDCASPRESSLDPDPAAVAARRLGGARAQVLDMTDLFCDERLCYPVIGGVLAYKDSNHLTRVFAETAGPILERRTDGLMRRWR